MPRRSRRRHDTAPLSNGYDADDEQSTDTDHSETSGQHTLMRQKVWNRSRHCTLFPINSGLDSDSSDYATFNAQTGKITDSDSSDYATFNAQTGKITDSDNSDNATFVLRLTR